MRAWGLYKKNIFRAIQAKIFLLKSAIILKTEFFEMDRFGAPQ